MGERRGMIYALRLSTHGVAGAEGYRKNYPSSGLIEPGTAGGFGEKMTFFVVSHILAL